MAVVLPLPQFAYVPLRSLPGVSFTRAERKRLQVVRVGMLHRCYNSATESFPRYGGRGIGVCQKWINSYFYFEEWAARTGFRVGLQLDRINNNGGYGPNNCRWTTPRANSNNRRSTLMLTAFGETKSAAEWARDPRCLVCYNTLKSRINNGRWDQEKAISVPLLRQRCAGAGRPRRCSWYVAEPTPTRK